MTRTTALFLASLTALTLGAVSWLTGSAAPAAAHDSTTTLSFDVHFAGFFLLDFGPDGVHQVTSFNQPFDPSRGDQTMFRDQMLRNGKVVGHDGGLCTVTEFVPTDPDPIKLTCQVNFELPGGQITTEGLTTNNPVKHLAVTGGTGRYTGAAGDLVLTEFGENDAGSAVFHLVGVRG